MRRHEDRVRRVSAFVSASPQIAYERVTNHADVRGRDGHVRRARGAVEEGDRPFSLRPEHLRPHLQAVRDFTDLDRFNSQGVLIDRDDLRVRENLHLRRRERAEVAADDLRGRHDRPQTVLRPRFGIGNPRDADLKVVGIVPVPRPVRGGMGRVRIEVGEDVAPVNPPRRQRNVAAGAP